jgi:hypothetical protein
VWGSRFAGLRVRSSNSQGLGAGLVGSGGVHQDHAVDAGFVLEVVVHAPFVHEAFAKGQIGLAVLHLKVQAGVALAGAVASVLFHL